MKQKPASSSRRLYKEINSQIEAVDILCAQIHSFLDSNNMPREGFTLELIARECLNNSVLHGNRADSRKKVSLSLSLGRRWIRMQVTDEGEGFNWRTLKKKIPDAMAICGRGLAISGLYADRISYNQRGNKITLWFDIRTTAKRYQHGKLHD